MTKSHACNLIGSPGSWTVESALEYKKWLEVRQTLSLLLGVGSGNETTSAIAGARERRTGRKILRALNTYIVARQPPVSS